MGHGLQGKVIRTSKLNLDLGSLAPSKEKQWLLHDTAIVSFFFWKRHKDHPQCYLVSPPAHQSGPRLLGIDLLCSRINALSHSHRYSRDCQRYSIGEPAKSSTICSKWGRLLTHWHSLCFSILLSSTFLLSVSRGLDWKCYHETVFCYRDIEKY